MKNDEIRSGMSYILIVDDNPADIKALKFLLSAEQLPIKSVTNGGDALSLIHSEPPELILLDISLPTMNGIEICNWIKSNTPTQDVPVIFLTAHADYEMKEKAFEAGAQDYITKPFHDGETLARVRNQLRIRESFRQTQEYHLHETLYLKNLIQIKDDFISTTTHDLKHPLSVFSTAVYLIRRLGPEKWDRVLEQLDSIERSLITMKQLVTDVLDLAQLESQIPNIQNVNLNRSILDAISELEPLAHKKQMRIQFETSLSDLAVKADPAHLSRILINILSNAIKYSSSGSNVSIRIVLDTEKEFAKIAIKDQGYGIAEDELEKIFNRFYRCNDNSHRKESGTGLGLSIVKSLIGQNSGEIHVASQVGAGSTFTLGFMMVES